MYKSCITKQNEIKRIFLLCNTEEEKYQKIMEWGRELTKLDNQFKTPENRVKGCQSTLFLHTFRHEGLLFFEGESDALISAGLAAILIKVYSGETPETILKCPPSYLEELGISASLTPSRANGLYSIHLRMKQEALKALMEPQC